MEKTEGISKELENNIFGYKGVAFNQDRNKFDKGIELLEKLALLHVSTEKWGQLNLLLKDESETASNIFDMEYIKLLNEDCAGVVGLGWDKVSNLAIGIEALLKKIYYLMPEKDNYDDGDTEITLRKLYKKIVHFDRWVFEENEVQDALKKEEETAKFFHRNRKIGMKIAEANPEYYRNCNCHIYDYIWVYQARNCAAHGNKIEDRNNCDEISKAVFFVMINECIRNERIINDAFDKQSLLELRVSFQPIITNKLKEQDEENKRFVQMEWTGNDEKKLTSSIGVNKIVGEPGLGKTTQMKHMFREQLNNLITKDGYFNIPVWISLASLNNSTNIDLKEMILNEFKEYCPSNDINMKIMVNRLLDRGALTLYLDGYDEIRNIDETRSALSRQLDDFNEEYKSVGIIVSDRQKNNRPPYLENAKIYTCSGMNKDKQKEYIEKNVPKDKHDLVKSIVFSKKLIDFFVSPEKINMLLDLVKIGKTRKTKEDFYEEYYFYLLERQRKEKKETRVDDFRSYMRKLAEQLDEKEHSAREVREAWDKENLNSDLYQYMLDLATEMRILNKQVEGHHTKYKFNMDYYYICVDDEG